MLAVSVTYDANQTNIFELGNSIYDALSVKDALMLCFCNWVNEGKALVFRIQTVADLHWWDENLTKMLTVNCALPHIIFWPCPNFKGIPNILIDL